MRLWPHPKLPCSGSLVCKMGLMMVRMLVLLLCKTVPHTYLLNTSSPWARSWTEENFLLRISPLPTAPADTVGVRRGPRGIPCSARTGTEICRSGQEGRLRGDREVREGPFVSFINTTGSRKRPRLRSAGDHSLVSKVLPSV